MTHNNYKSFKGRDGIVQEDKFIVPRRKPAVGKSTVVSVRLPNTTLARLEQIAGQTGRTRNELVQMCIDYAPANRKNKTKSSCAPIIQSTAAFLNSHKTAGCGFGLKRFLRRFFSKKRQISSAGRGLAGVEPPDDPVDEEAAPQQDHRP